MAVWRFDFAADSDQLDAELGTKTEELSRTIEKLRMSENVEKDSVFGTEELLKDICFKDIPLSGFDDIFDCEFQRSLDSCDKVCEVNTRGSCSDSIEKFSFIGSFLPTPDSVILSEALQVAAYIEHCGNVISTLVLCDNPSSPSNITGRKDFIVGTDELLDDVSLRFKEFSLSSCDDGPVCKFQRTFDVGASCMGQYQNDKNEKGNIASTCNEAPSTTGGAAVFDSPVISIDGNCTFTKNVNTEKNDSVNANETFTLNNCINLLDVEPLVLDTIIGNSTPKNSHNSSFSRRSSGFSRRVVLEKDTGVSCDTILAEVEKLNKLIPSEEYKLNFCSKLESNDNLYLVPEVCCASLKRVDTMQKDLTLKDVASRLRKQKRSSVLAAHQGPIKALAQFCKLSSTPDRHESDKSNEDHQTPSQSASSKPSKGSLSSLPSFGSISSIENDRHATFDAICSDPGIGTPETFRDGLRVTSTPTVKISSQTSVLCLEGDAAPTPIVWPNFQPSVVKVHEDKVSSNISVKNFNEVFVKHDLNLIEELESKVETVLTLKPEIYSECVFPIKDNVQKDNCSNSNNCEIEVLEEEDLNNALQAEKSPENTSSRVESKVYSSKNVCAIDKKKVTFFNRKSIITSEKTGKENILPVKKEFQSALDMKLSGEKKLSKIAVPSRRKSLLDRLPSTKSANLRRSILLPKNSVECTKEKAKSELLIDRKSNVRKTLGVRKSLLPNSLKAKNGSTKCESRIPFKKN